MGEEQKLYVKRLSYEGFFNFKEVFRTMDFWIRDKFYDKREHRYEEFKTPEGKQIELEFKPWKKVTDYYKIQIKIEMFVKGLRDVVIERNGKKVPMQHGSINIKLSGYLIVDYEHYWNKTPLLYFIRDMFDRFVYWYITKKYMKMTIDHIDDLYYTLSTYLNINTYKNV